MKSIINIIAITSLFCYLFGCNCSRENILMQEGNEYIKKIEHFKKINNTLPNSLSDIGISVFSESDPPIYYEKIDSIRYIISFGTTLGDSKIYYSDTKQWEDRYREMK